MERPKEWLQLLLKTKTICDAIQNNCFWTSPPSCALLSEVAASSESPPGTKHVVFSSSCGFSMPAEAETPFPDLKRCKLLASTSSSSRATSPGIRARNRTRICCRIRSSVARRNHPVYSWSKVTGPTFLACFRSLIRTFWIFEIESFSKHQHNKL